MTASDHVRWLSHPTLHSPAVIAAFSGWNDAADASSTAVRTLIEAWNAEPLAEIDPEEFIKMALEWGQPDGAVFNEEYEKKKPNIGRFFHGPEHYDLDIDGLRVSRSTDFC